MGQKIIQSIIAQNKGLIKDESTFRRTARGADGTGYPYMSDEQLNVLFMFYVAEFTEEVGDNG